MRKSPCYGCVERVFGCHGGCKKYKEWKSERTALRETINSEKDKQAELDALFYRAVERSKK